MIPLCRAGALPDCGTGVVVFERLTQAWRAFAAALIFIGFGVAGLVLGHLFFPALALFVRDPSVREGKARAAIRSLFKVTLAMAQRLDVLRLKAVGLERLDRGGLLIIANHPSLIDTVILMSRVRNADCIVKGALWRNPFTGPAVRAAGYARNEDGYAVIDACIASLHTGSNLIIFPEGTRTPADGAIRLRRGAANIAVRGGCNVTPVSIHCTPRVLGKNAKWWRMPRHPIQFTLEVHPDIDIASFIVGAPSEIIAARRLTAHLQDYFTMEFGRHAST